MGDAIRVVILTISDRSFRGERVDAGGPAVERALARIPAPTLVVERTILPDQREDIARSLERIADSGVADLVLTTGGTGLSPRDVTPQGTLDAADYEVPGLGEAMRAATRAALPAADLSRGTAVVRRRTLVVNLPGSPRGAVECLEVVARLLPHAVATLRGEDHVPSSGLTA
jgi:molybdenum cofactor synthesis domain-containing protein